MSDNKNPQATLTLRDGSTIVMELYPQIAPNTVNNFISLINKGFYNGLNFHRIVPGFVIQGGCPLGTGTGGPGYGIKGEFKQNGFENALAHEKGVLSMARSMQADSAGSQFFIMLGQSPHLDGGYAAFGKVTDEAGLAVVDAIVAQTKEPLIDTITVDTFGVDYPEPDTLPGRG